MKNTTFNNIEVGDLVIGVKENSADVRFVEGADRSDNPDELHVLLVNGSKDKSYQGQSGIDRFNEEWRLLMKGDSLFKEDRNSELIFGYPEDDSLFMIQKEEVINNLYKYEISSESAIIYEDINHALIHYQDVLNKFEEEFEKEIEEAYESTPLYRSYGVEVHEHKVCKYGLDDISYYYIVSVNAPLYYSLSEVYIWLKGVIKELKAVIKTMNEDKEKEVEKDTFDHHSGGRDIKRIKPFLKEFESLWLKFPDLRFGQLISMLGSNFERGLHLPEEEEWLQYIKYVKERQKQ